MTDDLVNELRDAAFLGFEDGTRDYSIASEAADRIEALTAKCEALGQEVNMAKYGQPDFAWSIHVEAMADLEADNARLRYELREQIHIRQNCHMMPCAAPGNDSCECERMYRAALTGKETK
jgi:hypothetical protein